VPVDIAERPVAISALQHWRYCPRQCGLIHLEQAFVDNVYTQRGQAVHANVDTPSIEVRAGLRIERALPIWSERLGLVGKADLVEFEPDGTPYPVEYKHGSRRKNPRIAACDELQLAAQAVCLEEMTGRSVGEGALFYATSKRRRVVFVTDALRDDVVKAAAAVREMLELGRLPKPENDERCRACSLIDVCQPEAISVLRTATRLRDRLFDPDN
jgi:CRISPR-associated exonuclease Cas4